MAGILLDQGTELKFDEWRVTSDTPVVAATLALQQAETIFYMDMDAVDGLKGVWSRFTLCRSADERHRPSYGKQKEEVSVDWKKGAKRPNVLLGALVRYTSKRRRAQYCCCLGLCD